MWFFSSGFGIIAIIVLIVILLFQVGKKYPLFGMILVGCAIAFVIATCEQYKEDWPDEEERQRKSEEHMKEFNRKLKEEGQYYQQKWEREHPEEAKREREREQWRKEHGYK